MPQFQIVKSPSEIPQDPQWKDSQKFHSKERFCRLDGKKLADNSLGAYQIIAKKEYVYLLSSA